MDTRPPHTTRVLGAHCLVQPDKVFHKKQCEGKIFGCKCSERNNLKLAAVGRADRLNNLWTSDEEIDNVKNEQKLVVGSRQAGGPCHSDQAAGVPMERAAALDINNFKIHNSISDPSAVPSTKPPESPSPLAMAVTWPGRGRRRVCLLCSALLLLLCLATSLPLLLQQLGGVAPSDPAPPVQYVPLQNVYHQIYNRDSVFEGIKPPRESSSKGENYQSSLSARSKETLSQVFISVKTTSRYHYPRLVILLETWASLVPDTTWFFTDTAGDPELVRRTGGRLVATNCSSSHHRLSLCCKMEKEFEYFLKSHKQWWCHFDDDNFVNVVSLAQLLQRHDPGLPWYLGKTSTASPLRVMSTSGANSSFWFATGGAGFCVSRTLAMRMAPFAVDGKFVEAGNQFWFPDDVTLGYIIEGQLGVNLTVVPSFHSHLETMAALGRAELLEDITFSYLLEEDKTNTISLGGPFPPSVDPTRFYSLYCTLFKAELCPG